MVGGYPVLETVRPTRIFGDVAADRACGLTRGIRHILEAQRGDSFGEPCVDHTGLNNSATLNRIDSENVIQAGERNEHRIPFRPSAAGKTGTCSSRNEGHLDEV